MLKSDQIKNKMVAPDNVNQRSHPSEPVASQPARECRNADKETSQDRPIRATKEDLRKRQPSTPSPTA